MHIESESKRYSSLLVENIVSLENTLDEDEHIKAEIDTYLRQKTSISVESGLKDFPIIRNIFLKYNCIRSSEAICERMFSYAGNFISNFT